MKLFIPSHPRTIHFTLATFPRHPTRSLTMSTPAAPRGTPTQTKPSIPKGKTELKILMLHGYTQSGPLFSSKTKALSKLLIKALSPAPYNLHPTLLFPTAPHRLRPSDIPGYVPPEEDEDDEESDNWAWFRKDEATGAYRGFEEGMQSIAAEIAKAGGIDGVCGFSQGGAVAALVAAALEQPYRDPPSSSHAASPSDPSSQPEEADWSWVNELRRANNNQALSFSVVYSGFYAPIDSLRWLYEPPITTPTLHFLGSLDTVVEESRSKGLVDRCKDPTVIVHPGGHYVPVAKDWAMALAGWLRQRYEDPEAASKRSL
ncbi:serine hydrolase-domain-containing protein [Daldinia decipiens]|uniref:serine hydrolase-domain-containing protein n=1 Tax=Daldinia decipiens TaxID=326647 RepID=UPI0020C2FF18|nr:serine hydrolase-domain-containing protein [Daldinia decipiens]KAI1655952.1 serine hydrolase-domain-containing protein [Daldinia decipiens]